jgi:hypothetical protein
MQLKKRAVGLAAGIMWGLTVMLGTWFLLLMDSGGLTISKLRVFYFGYSFTFVGGIVGLLWGFIDGFICGVIFAWLYNMFAKAKAQAK